MPVRRGDAARAASPTCASRGLGRQGEVDRAGRRRARADAELELDAAYAPIPTDTRAILRQKTLLGETYVELTPGSDESLGGLGHCVRDDPRGRPLPEAQVADSVQLDEIFRAFDEPTRDAFQAWMQGQAAALRGPRRRPLGRDRQPRPVRRGGRPGAAHARQPAARRAAARPRRRRGLRRALRAPGPASRPDLELRRRSSRPPPPATRSWPRPSGSSRPSCASRGRR